MTAAACRAFEEALDRHLDASGPDAPVPETLGHAARTAVRMGLSLPLLDAVYRIAAAIDRTTKAERCASRSVIQRESLA